MENLQSDYFELDNEIELYMKEDNFIITIDLPKICYSKGEKLGGKIQIKPKVLKSQSLLNSTIAGYAELKELQKYTDISDAMEEDILFKYPMIITHLEGNNGGQGIYIPFEFQIPHYSYPSFFFDKRNYVKHILIFNLFSIKARKSIVLVIKNNKYFAEYNHLFKSPVQISMRTSKHKLAIFHKGYIAASLKLEKNVFAYDEPIHLEIDIDCSTLKIQIINVYVNMYRSINKNNTSNHKDAVYKNEIKILTKIIPLKEKKDNYHIEDSIQFPEGHPGEIYNSLIEEQNPVDKCTPFPLYPPCYGGLLSCEYYIKVKFETDTLFSTDEF
jgi:hypothetical protein